MQKIRIKIKGYDSRVVDQAAAKIIDTAMRTGAKVSGPIPLPTRRKLYTVNESPHVDKRAMEHFEMKIHKRLIEIIEPTSKTVDSLTHLQLAAGVEVRIK